MRESLTFYLSLEIGEINPKIECNRDPWSVIRQMDVARVLDEDREHDECARGCGNVNHVQVPAERVGQHRGT